MLVEEEGVESLLRIVCRFDENRTCHSGLLKLDIQRTGFTREGFIKIIRTINTTAL